MNNRIKELRKQHGLTQDDLALALHVTRQTVVAIEKGKFNPSLELALKLSRLFSLPIEELFQLSDIILD
ncbi:MAG: helix-turn-helix transcriptional regulator [Candidatus Diapherotrites archaeon]|nr:helix-turn-helix transcriptional regulator [Candidatus Diapherotrites archaeon]